MTEGPEPVADPFSLEGRTALVTGANRGLGRAFADAIALLSRPSIQESLACRHWRALFGCGRNMAAYACPA